MRNLIGPLFLLVSCLLFSVTGTLQQLAPEGHTPVVITEVRMLLGSLTILAWCLLNHRLPSNWSGVPWKPMLIAVASVLLYQLLFFYSVEEVGVAVGSVVAIATTPLWAATVAFILFKKRPSRFWVSATALAIVGVSLINAGGGLQSQRIDWRLLLPIAAGLCYGVEIIAVGKVVEKINPETTMLLEMGLVAILLFPVIFFFPTEWIFTTRGILVSLGLGVVTAGIAYPCFTYGIKYTSPIVASTLALTEPLMAAALGIFFLHENLSISMGLGMLSLMASVIVLIFEEPNNHS
ncbi:DMT family transporter [Parasutterella excrementihominis]|uniref:DMT family transporter n=1 Tax=Parasutterella excrementihominis TaxID=487175 RepID=UPI003A8D5EB3